MTSAVWIQSFIGSIIDRIVDSNHPDIMEKNRYIDKIYFLFPRMKRVVQYIPINNSQEVSWYKVTLDSNDNFLWSNDSFAMFNLRHVYVNMENLMALSDSLNDDEKFLEIAAVNILQALRNSWWINKYPDEDYLDIIAGDQDVIDQYSEDAVIVANRAYLEIFS